MIGAQLSEEEKIKVLENVYGEPNAQADDAFGEGESGG